MKTKKTGAALRLLLGSLIAVGLMGMPTAATAGDAAVATEVAPAAAPPTSAAPAANTPTPADPPVALPPPAAVASTEPVPVPVPQTGLEAFRDQVLAILIPAFVLLIGALAAAALSKVKKKLGLEISEQTTVQWQALAQSAALRAAEWARKKAKELTDGKKVPGPAVLDVAVNWATDMAVAQGLPELARAKLEGLIESELFKLRREDPPADQTNAKV